ncbi:AMP-dependent synthetase/ligase [Botrimarina mediterranea]|uniref:AMP-dependent synthetase/ligase n=1 Tax=Botrimarina mediterranea TaxID=2528022 RepID=UPI001187CEA8|nr:Long-chain-fatty-acid--CoA ligase FadD15 [Planctomycetes bacterium K2D]
MSSYIPTIAELLEATASRCSDRAALGYWQGNDVNWLNWSQVGVGARNKADWWEAVDEPHLGWSEKNLEHPVWDALALHLAHLRRIPEGDRYRSEYPPELSTIVETAGTSGEPRGVMLSEANLASNAIALSEASGGDGDELRLSFLPMEHLYARTCDLYTWVVRGSRLVLAESPKTVFRDAKIVRPTVINGVPYFFQKAIDLADKEGLSLRQLLGGEIKRCYCGGALLAPAVEQRFFDEGVPLFTGYGLTEASPVVTVNTPAAYKLGTVGRPLPGVEVRIASDGEVLVRGPNVMLGYYNDPEATAAALRDGWLYTGDLGELDSDGFLTITGRKKELIVLATGKNVAPSRVEALLCASPWIEQACVFGDGEKGLRALIVPNPQRLRAEIKRRRLWVWSKRGALRHAAVQSLYREVIDACLAGAAREEQVHSFTLIGRGFERERGEMTAKLSLRREVIAKNFARE